MYNNLYCILTIYVHVQEELLVKTQLEHQHHLEAEQQKYKAIISDLESSYKQQLYHSTEKSNFELQQAVTQAVLTAELASKRALDSVLGRCISILLLYYCIM